MCDQREICPRGKVHSTASLSPLFHRYRKENKERDRVNRHNYVCYVRGTVDRSVVAFLF